MKLVGLWIDTRGGPPDFVLRAIEIVERGRRKGSGFSFVFPPQPPASYHHPLAARRAFR